MGAKIEVGVFGYGGQLTKQGLFTLKMYVGLGCLGLYIVMNISKIHVLEKEIKRLRMINEF